MWNRIDLLISGVTLGSSRIVFTSSSRLKKLVKQVARADGTWATILDVLPWALRIDDSDQFLREYESSLHKQICLDHSGSH